MRISLLNWPFRNIYLLIMVFVGLIISKASYMMYILNLKPCSLCITQQFLYFLIVIVSFLVFVFNPRFKVYIFYTFVLSILTVLGIWVSARQVWLQNLSEDIVPSCGPSLEYIVNALPFKDVLFAIFIGDGNCAKVEWTFLSLSIAGWSLILFIILFLLCLLIIIRGYCYIYK